MKLTCHIPHQQFTPFLAVPWSTKTSNIYPSKKSPWLFFIWTSFFFGGGLVTSLFNNTKRIRHQVMFQPNLLGDGDRWPDTWGPRKAAWHHCRYGFGWVNFPCWFMFNSSLTKQLLYKISCKGIWILKTLKDEIVLCFLFKMVLEWKKHTQNFGITQYVPFFWRKKLKEHHGSFWEWIH